MASRQPALRADLARLTSAQQLTIALATLVVAMVFTAITVCVGVFLIAGDVSPTGSLLIFPLFAAAAGWASWTVFSGRSRSRGRAEVVRPRR